MPRLPRGWRFVTNEDRAVDRAVQAFVQRADTVAAAALAVDDKAEAERLGAEIQELMACLSMIEGIDDDAALPPEYRQDAILALLTAFSTGDTLPC